MNNRKRVLVSRNISAAGWALLKDRADIEAIPYDSGMPEADFLKLLPDVDGIALSMRGYGAAELAAGDAMKVIGRYGVGYDSVDVPGCTARKIVLLTTGTANSLAVTEQAIAWIFELARRTAAFNAMVREGRWKERIVQPPMELTGRTVLVVGYGRIGSRVARRLVGLEMRTLVCDPYVSSSHIEASGARKVTLEEAVPQADFITIHCPRNAETVDLFDAARLAAMKKGAFLINTARGGIANEAALHDALASGHLAGAALDVFDHEPILPDDKLLSLPNVLFGPHVAGCTGAALDRMSATTIANVLSVLDGKPNLENVVNPEALG